ncbi:hypothetical protein [Ferruginibacter albus]|uniref:hypothetical protein n=1 Tax=Ferruginibacter albus TaxID=2875540 RepID=UPI001CC46FBE|nr:hypothetical protein [Ferruginibacter albus]UAY52303.1 hypothetical protein K9M53_01090 [Ferruginibacter albus]
MADAIILIFLCWGISIKARKKGLSSIRWIFYTIAAWFGAELFIGAPLALSLSHINAEQLRNMVLNPTSNADLSQLLLFELIALMAAFGGYLVIRYNLEKKPDYDDNEKKDVGIDDLKPPVK